MSTLGWVVIALASAFVGGVAVYFGWLYWAYKQFDNTDL